MGQICHQHLRVQGDWKDAVVEKDLSFWVSSISNNEAESKHVKVNIEEAAKGTVSTCGISVEDLSKRSFTLKSTAFDGMQQASVQVLPYQKQYKEIDPNESMTAFAMSSDGHLAAVGGMEGGIRVINALTGQPKRHFSDCIGPINALQFFPSDDVILAGGADMKLRIFSVSQDYCGAVLTGHKGAITTAALIDRGRNFLSGSNDGTVRLWDTASQSTIREFTDLGIVHQVATSNTGYESKMPADSREVSTEGHLVAVASSIGCRVFDIRDPSSTLYTFTTEAVLSCVMSDKALTFAHGKSLTTICLTSFKESTMSSRPDKVIKIADFKSGFLVAFDDGGIQVLKEDHSTETILTGPDSDSILGLRASFNEAGTTVMAASTDAVFRYRIV